MASAIDDLRDISRYGYTDPWAEATKSISDSLLSYADSKFKRDALLAEYKDKERQDEYDRNRDTKNDILGFLSDMSPDVQNTILQNKPDLFGDYNVNQSIIDANTSTIAFNTETQSNLETARNTNLTLDERRKSVLWLKSNVEDSGIRNMATSIQVGLQKSHEDSSKHRLIDQYSKTYLEKALINKAQYDQIQKELKEPGGSLVNAENILDTGLKSNRAVIEDIIKRYDDEMTLIALLAEKWDWEEPEVQGRIDRLEDSLIPYLDPRVQNLRRIGRPDGSPFTFAELIAAQQFGPASEVFDTPFWERFPGYKNMLDRIVPTYGDSTSVKAPVVRDSTIVDTDGSLTNKIDLSTVEGDARFQIDSSNRFAVDSSDFAMPPESQVQLVYANGTKKTVTGENAYKQLQRDDVSYADSSDPGNRSGMYLKIGVGADPVYAERIGTKMMGPEDREGRGVTVVYQNPSKKHYEGVIGLRDTALSTRNIVLKSGDLLMDGKTGKYHKVLIIPPPEGQPLTKALTERPLDKTVFRVGAKDYKAEELIKKFMVPMSIPPSKQSVTTKELDKSSSGITLLNVTPVKLPDNVDTTFTDTTTAVKKKLLR